MGAQIIHGAGESSPGSLPDNTYAVCLTAKNEQDLLCLEERLIRDGVPHKAVRETDAPYNGQLMCLGFVPCDRKLLRKYLSNYPLLK